LSLIVLGLVDSGILSLLGTPLFLLKRAARSPRKRAVLLLLGGRILGLGEIILGGGIIVLGSGEMLAGSGELSLVTVVTSGFGLSMIVGVDVTESVSRLVGGDTVPNGTESRLSSLTSTNESSSSAGALSTINPLCTTFFPSVLEAGCFVGGWVVGGLVVRSVESFGVGSVGPVDTLWLDDTRTTVNSTSLL